MGNLYLQTFNWTQNPLGMKNSSLEKPAVFLCFTKDLLTSIQTHSKKQNSILYLKNHLFLKLSGEKV